MDGIGGKGIARGKSNSPDWIDRARSPKPMVISRGYSQPRAQGLEGFRDYCRIEPL